jgi:hypothetical protein
MHKIKSQRYLHFHSSGQYKGIYSLHLNNWIFTGNSFQDKMLEDFSTEELVAKLREMAEHVAQVFAMIKQMELEDQQLRQWELEDQERKERGLDGDQQRRQQIQLEEGQRQMDLEDQQRREKEIDEVIKRRVIEHEDRLKRKKLEERQRWEKKMEGYDDTMRRWDDLDGMNLKVTCDNFNTMRQISTIQ